MVFAGAVELFNVLARRNRNARTKRQQMRERHQ
jgi:hypothetical protein